MCAEDQTETHSVSPQGATGSGTGADRIRRTNEDDIVRASQNLTRLWRDKFEGVRTFAGIPWAEMVVRAVVSSLGDTGFLGLRPETVPAGEVRRGDWVRWPESTDTMRRITDLGPPQSNPDESHPDGVLHYVSAYSEYDDHEYEWLDSQPVEVWRPNPSASDPAPSAEPARSAPNQSGGAA